MHKTYVTIILMKKVIKTSKSFFIRHKIISSLIIILAVLVVGATIISLIDRSKTAIYQSSIASFYDTSNIDIDGPVGQMVRSEPTATSLKNGTATRVIYRTQKADGTNTFSSGMVYIPSTNSPTPRPVVAWAHGTLGMGDDCAPSRQQDTIASTGMGWVDTMLQRGWVVTATDYAGFGTPGIEAYLVGQAEAHDVLNSIRALRDLPAANAGSRYAIWGHSQGGHSALFSSDMSTAYLPEYELVGTAATAPAAQLESLLSQQFTTAVAWLIGPEVVVSWPNNYSGLSPEQVLTKPGLNNYKSMAQACIKSVAIDGIIRQKIGQDFFSPELLKLPAWKQVIAEQTAPVLGSNRPLLVGESLTDQVVLPNTTAQYIQRACQSGSDLTSIWLTDVGHVQLQSVISPSVINWLGDRFANIPTSPTCNQPLPITPSQS